MRKDGTFSPIGFSTIYCFERGSNILSTANPIKLTGSNEQISPFFSFAFFSVEIYFSMRMYAIVEISNRNNPVACFNVQCTCNIRTILLIENLASFFHYNWVSIHRRLYGFYMRCHSDPTSCPSTIITTIFAFLRRLHMVRWFNIKPITNDVVFVDFLVMLLRTWKNIHYVKSWRSSVNVRTFVITNFCHLCSAESRKTIDSPTNCVCFFLSPEYLNITTIHNFSTDEYFV